MASKIKCIYLFIFILASCEDRVTQCNLAERRIKEWHGNIIVDSIFNDWRNHAQAAMDKNGNKVLYMPSNLVKQPEKGDSLYKDSGTVEYVLVKKDSVYIQKWDCLHLKHMVKASKLLQRLDR